jgi:DNA replication and repair protein RecF
MYLKSLHLRSFRNYRECLVDFDAPKTILVGNNAQGKSNLLEAVELLATLKSHRAVRDRDLVCEGTAEGKIAATLERANGTVDLALTYALKRGAPYPSTPKPYAANSTFSAYSTLSSSPV